jgi:hypothetical protein
MNIKRTIAAFIAAAVMMLSSCTEADITVKGGQGSAENKFPKEENKFVLTVNVSSGTFHLDENCRYVKNIKEENKKIISYSEVETAIADGFKACSACAAEYKTTEENYG